MDSGFAIQRRTRNTHVPHHLLHFPVIRIGSDCLLTCPSKRLLKMLGSNDFDAVNRIYSHMNVAY